MCVVSGGREILRSITPEEWNEGLDNRIMKIAKKIVDLYSKPD